MNNFIKASSYEVGEATPAQIFNFLSIVARTNFIFTGNGAVTNLVRAAQYHVNAKKYGSLRNSAGHTKYRDCPPVERYEKTSQYRNRILSVRFYVFYDAFNQKYTFPPHHRGNKSGSEVSHSTTWYIPLNIYSFKEDHCTMNSHVRHMVALSIPSLHTCSFLYNLLILSPLLMVKIGNSDRQISIAPTTINMTTPAQSTIREGNFLQYR